jgi:methylated-DNA-[protein]-cysteine S-methyltransferase
MQTAKTTSPRRTIVRCSFASPLGPMTLAATELGLAGAWFDGQKHMPEMAHWPLRQNHPVLLRAQQELGQYFAGTRQTFGLPLDIQGGTEFQQQIWQGLLHIASGTTTSYGALAQRIGRPAAVRAVGAAVGRNPISIIVPCHRVVGADGSLTGYAGGLERKIALLQLEQGRAATIAA